LEIGENLYLENVKMQVKAVNSKCKIDLISKSKNHGSKVKSRFNIFKIKNED